MNQEIYKSFLAHLENDPSVLFTAWTSGEKGVIFLTICHFCYDAKKDIFPDTWFGYRVDKIKGIYTKGRSKLCVEHE